MSAYGVVSRPPRPYNVPATTWPHPHDSNATVTLFRIDATTIADSDIHPGLFNYLHTIFADEVDKGLTYPQEDLRNPDAFRAYFFAADVMVAVVGDRKEDGDGISPDPRTDTEPVGKEVDVDLEKAREGRSWEACMVGFYYVKPNYPGRSSHICNAGFVVPPSHRSSGYGRVLARSFLYYGPRLGYQASVFNLVYVNNVASIRLWEKLGFTKAGLIPKAGRLKRIDGPGEEYVDAWVFYKSFDEVGKSRVADAVVS